MNLKQANELLKEFHTPIHVRAHSRKVAFVAKKLAKALKKEGIHVNEDLVYLGGIIHDFVRIVDFKSLAKELGDEKDQIFWKKLRKKYKGWHHADAGADILEKRGEKELARMVKSHKFSALTNKEGPKTWEEKLVYYADKRVMHDKIVSLKERLKEGWKRHYGDQKKSSKEEALQKAIIRLEQKIFRIIPSSKRF